jgi:hypothetical protein
MSGKAEMAVAAVGGIALVLWGVGLFRWVRQPASYTIPIPRGGAAAVHNQDAKTAPAYYPQRVIFVDPAGNSVVGAIHVLDRSGLNIDPVVAAKSDDTAISLKIERGRSALWKFKQDVVYVKLNTSRLPAGEHDADVDLKINTGAHTTRLVRVPIVSWVSK